MRVILVECVFVFVGGCLRGSHKGAGRNSVSRARQAPPCHRSKRTRDERTEREDEHSAQWIPGAVRCEACPRHGDQCIQETAGGRGAQVRHTHTHSLDKELLSSEFNSPSLSSSFQPPLNAVISKGQKCTLKRESVMLLLHYFYIDNIASTI